MDFGRTQEDAEDRWDAHDAFEELLNERFLPRLAELSAEDAELWSRALVEEHLCDHDTAAQFTIYESLVEYAQRARENDVEP